MLPELTGARGIAQEAVSDGVVLREGDRIALGPLLSGVEPGAYRAVVAPDGAGAAVTVPLTAGGPSPPLVVIPRAADGVYTLVLRSADGRDVLSNEAWFLAVAPDRFPASKSVYDAALALTRSWSNSAANAEVATLFLRRVLHALVGGE